MASSNARSLRQNPTDAEIRLWSKLRRRQVDGHRFRRQVPIGRYVVDFVCLEQRLIIEADGGQHSENLEDDVRTAWLERQGFRILRFWNNDVLTNTEGVLIIIQQHLAPGTPLPDPPPRGEGVSCWRCQRPLLLKRKSPPPLRGRVSVGDATRSLSPQSANPNPSTWCLGVLVVQASEHRNLDGARPQWHKTRIAA